MNPVQCVFFFFSLPLKLSLHRVRLDLFWYLAKRKKRASVRVCQMFLFLCVHFSSVSLAASNKQIDRSWTFSVKSLRKTEAKSDVIYSGKDWKQGSWFNNVISNPSNDCNPLKLQWKSNPTDQCFSSAWETLNPVFVHFAHHTISVLKYFFFSGLYIVITAKQMLYTVSNTPGLLEELLHSVVYRVYLVKLSKTLCPQ